MRLIQHKREAFWFYRFLSIFYDDYVNPFFWTPAMRAKSLALAALNDDALDVVDVGSGTGFTTEGIVEHVRPTHITCIDQSPHQMAHARRKPALQECTFIQGDAEDLPFPDDTFDRYVSAGSIEYWPEPQRGIAEAYRVIKPGGLALMIGPLRPRNGLARLVADTWMLFPEEEDYQFWFQRAGFVNIKKVYVKPSWVRREKYGVAMVGMKPSAGPSPLALPPAKAEDLEDTLDLFSRLKAGVNLAVGSVAGSLFIPAAIVGRVRHAVEQHMRPPDEREPEDPVTPQQVIGAFAVTGLVAMLVTWLFRRKR